MSGREVIVLGGDRASRARDGGGQQAHVCASKYIAPAPTLRQASSALLGQGASTRISCSAVRSFVTPCWSPFRSWTMSEIQHSQDGPHAACRSGRALTAKSPQSGVCLKRGRVRATPQRPQDAGDEEVTPVQCSAFFADRLMAINGSREAENEVSIRTNRSALKVTTRHAPTAVRVPVSLSGKGM